MSQTNENLRSELTNESQANMRYIMFSEVAKREGYCELASRFRRTAEEETKHARALFEMLYPQIFAKDALKMALEIETLETRIYSEYTVTGEKEGKVADASELKRLLNEAKKHFEEFAAAEKEHADATKKGLELLFPGV
jgi:rubrerythrin